MSTFLLPCLIFLQLAVTTLLTMGLCPQAKAKWDRFSEYPVRYVWQSPQYFYPALTVEVTAQSDTIQKKRRASRGPASTVPRDDIQPEPITQEIWLNNVWVEDSAGVMNQIKNEFSNWEKIEEYRRNWDIESTGLYETPDRGSKRNFFSKMMFRYLDKRVSGELKNAEEGSALQKVRSVKQALKPNTTASISNNIKLKFRAKLLRMRAYMKIVNPWVNAETEFNVNGRVFSRLQKRFESLGVDTRFEYRLHDNDYTASVSKPLGNNITAVVSSTQSASKVAFMGDADSTFQLQYYTSF